MSLIQCGQIELMGRAVNSLIKGDEQQWFDMFQVRVGAAQVLAVEVIRGHSGSAKAADSVDVDADAARVASVLAKSRLITAMKQTASRTLTTLDVKIEGKATNVTGAHKVGGATIAIEQDVSKSIGHGFVEVVRFETPEAGMQIVSSVAGKFANDVDRIRNIHVDIAFTKLDAAKCSGALPEIWGVKSMSKATAKLLLAPR